MANDYKYRVIVKGKRNACMAFLGSMPHLTDKRINFDEGTNESCKLFFEGDCSLPAHYGSMDWDGEFPVELPEDAEEAYSLAEQNYGSYDLKSRSKMFNVEVRCNYAQINCDEEIFVHYFNGKRIDDYSPQELTIFETWYGDPYEDDRVKAYYGDYDGNDSKLFKIKYENSVINEVLKKYSYTLKKVDGVYSLNDEDDLGNPFDISVEIQIDTINPHYMGVTNLGDLTSTLINFLITIGNAEPGFAEEMINRMDEIMNSFSYIFGTSQESVEPYDSEWQEGYDFELIKGVYRSRFRRFPGGW